MFGMIIFKRIIFCFFLFCLFLPAAFTSDYSTTAKRILLLDDSRNSYMLKPWKDALEYLNKSFQVMTTEDNEINLEILKKYQIVIWVTGGHANDLSTLEVKLIRDYARAGGNILVTGEKTGYPLRNWGIDSLYFG
ncbi:hypothetical protein ACFL35_21280, partial [Candidatus Riflebacteria bacterium]